MKAPLAFAKPQKFLLYYGIEYFLRAYAVRMCGRTFFSKILTISSDSITACGISRCVSSICLGYCSHRLLLHSPWIDFLEPMTLMLLCLRAILPRALLNFTKWSSTSAYSMLRSG